MAKLHIIRDLVERKKMTIRELASRIGKDESSIQAMMRAGSTNTATLEKIAETLNVPVGIFFDEGTLQNEREFNSLIQSQQRTIENLSETVRDLLKSKPK